MESHGEWYKGIEKQIARLKDTLSEADYKKYKLNMLLCIARRLDQFSAGCGQCNLFQQDITSLVQDVGNLAQVGDKQKRKAHNRAINKIIGHLQKQHKLVTEGYYMGIWTAIGSGIGVAIGAATDNVGSGIPIGVGIGVAIGAGLDAKARKEGRVICPREKTNSRFSRKVLVVAIGLGLLALGGLLAYMFYRGS